jgi:hypothetical protein
MLEVPLFMHHEFILEGTRVNKENYKESHLQITIHLKYPEIWMAKNHVFLYDNIRLLTKQQYYSTSPPIVLSQFTSLQLNGYHFKDVAVKGASKISFQKAAHGGFQKYFKLYKQCHRNVPAKLLGFERNCVYRLLSVARFEMWLLSWIF